MDIQHPVEDTAEVPVVADTAEVPVVVDTAAEAVLITLSIFHLI